MFVRLSRVIYSAVTAVFFSTKEKVIREPLNKLQSRGYNISQRSDGVVYPKGMCPIPVQRKPTPRREICS